jgi:6-phosphogluconolactonase
VIVPPDRRVVAADATAFADAAARRVASHVDTAVRARGRAVVALAGGSTPAPVYRRLADRAPALPWSSVVAIFGDERCVDADDPGSNYRLARETLLDRVPIPADHVHRMQGEHPDPAEAARRYDAVLERLFAAPGWPVIDLALLGVGEDGHTASLFPQHPVLAERTRRTAAVRTDGAYPWRLTLTVPVFRAARAILFLVSGPSKARVVAEAFGGRPHDGTHPCELVWPEAGSVEVVLDRSAAALLA